MSTRRARLLLPHALLQLLARLVLDCGVTLPLVRCQDGIDFGVAIGNYFSGLAPLGHATDGGVRQDRFDLLLTVRDDRRDGACLSI